MKLNLTRPIAFFDLETTGLSITKDRIIEIAILKVNPDNTTEERTWLINPGMPIPAQSTRLQMKMLKISHYLKMLQMI